MLEWLKDKVKKGKKEPTLARADSSITPGDVLRARYLTHLQIQAVVQIM